ncbi:ribonuclease HII, partial [Methanosarcinales archaeon]
ERFETKVLKISPQKIDKMREEMSMDWIMVHAFAHLVRGVDVAYVDAADVDAERFGKRISELAGQKIKIISMHKADEKIPVVSAASIVAKV